MMLQFTGVGTKTKNDCHWTSPDSGLWRIETWAMAGANDGGSGDGRRGGKDGGGEKNYLNSSAMSF